MNRREFFRCSSAVAAAAGGVRSPTCAPPSTAEPSLAADPHRPQYHFLPSANWMNDPNGPIYWKGKYHMFYQHNPKGAYPDTMHWGHGVGEDMVRWKHLPIALAPTPGGPDKDGCFSGCAVDHNGVPTLVYTGVWPTVQCVATSDDELIAWKKHPANPVVAAPPAGHELIFGFGDPAVWSEGSVWRMLLGAGVKGVGGTVFLYESQDLVQWKYLQPLFVGKMDPNAKGSERWIRGATSEEWACPDFFPLGEKHVLLFSSTTRGKVLWFSGRYAGAKFHPEAEGQVDFGSYFAAKSMVDAHGNRILWGWVRERRSDKAQRAAGWSGVLSLPRELTLGLDGTLRMESAVELEKLRGRDHALRDVTVKADSSGLLRDVAGEALEIVAEVDPLDAEACGLRVCCSPGREEETLIYYDRADGKLVVDRRRSSLDDQADRGVSEGAFRLAAGERLYLHVFIDGSVIEIFANRRACLTDRVYPTRKDSVGVGLLARGGSGKLISLNAWQVNPISKDRLTT